MSVEHDSFDVGVLETAATVLSKDDVINNMVAEINEYAPCFRINKIKEITKSTYMESINHLNLLSGLVHFYLSHNQFFQDIMAKTPKPTQDKINLFMSSLSEKGKNGLRIKFLAENYHRRDPHGIYAVSDELILESIRDENGDNIGICPFIKLELTSNIDHPKEPKYFLVPLHRFKNMISILQSMYEHNTIQVKKYGDKLKDEMLIYDE